MKLNNLQSEKTKILFYLTVDYRLKKDRLSKMLLRIGQYYIPDDIDEVSSDDLIELKDRLLRLINLIDKDSREEIAEDSIDTALEALEYAITHSKKLNFFEISTFNGGCYFNALFEALEVGLTTIVDNLEQIDPKETSNSKRYRSFKILFNTVKIRLDDLNISIPTYQKLDKMIANNELERQLCDFELFMFHKLLENFYNLIVQVPNDKINFDLVSKYITELNTSVDADCSIMLTCWDYTYEYQYNMELKSQNFCGKKTMNLSNNTKILFDLTSCYNSKRRRLSTKLFEINQHCILDDVSLDQLAEYKKCLLGLINLIYKDSREQISENSIDKALEFLEPFHYRIFSYELLQDPEAKLELMESDFINLFKALKKSTTNIIDNMEQIDSTDISNNKRYRSFKILFSTVKIRLDELNIYIPKFYILDKMIANNELERQLSDFELFMFHKLIEKFYNLIERIPDDKINFDLVSKYITELNTVFDVNRSNEISTYWTSLYCRE